MSWEEQMFDLFDDLEAQAEVEFAAERAYEVADRMRAEYRAVTFMSRLHASLGHEVGLTVRGVGSLRGRIARTGDGWLLLAEGPRSWLVLADAVTLVVGAAPASVPTRALPTVQRLSPASPLRRLAEEYLPVVLHTTDAATHRGRVGRVGADFVELGPENGLANGPPMLIPWTALSAVQSLTL